MCNVSQGLIDKGIKQGIEKLADAINKVKYESYSLDMLLEEAFKQGIFNDTVQERMKSLETQKII